MLNMKLICALDVLDSRILKNPYLTLLEAENEVIKPFQIELSRDQNNNIDGNYKEQGITAFDKIIQILACPTAEITASTLIKASRETEISNGWKLERIRQIKLDAEGIQKMTAGQKCTRTGVAKMQQRVASNIEKMGHEIEEEGLVASMESLSLNTSFKAEKARSRLSSVEAVHPYMKTNVVYSALEKLKQLQTQRKDIVTRTDQIIFGCRSCPSPRKKRIPISDVLNVTVNKVMERKKDLESLYETINEFNTSLH